MPFLVKIVSNALTLDITSETSSIHQTMGIILKKSQKSRKSSQNKRNSGWDQVSFFDWELALFQDV